MGLRDLDNFLAREILGWEATYPKMESGDHFSARGDAFRWGDVKARYPGGLAKEDWVPTRKLQQAISLFEAENPIFQLLDIRYNDLVSKWVVRAYNGRTTVIQSDKLLSLAICIAAKRCIDLVG